MPKPKTTKVLAGAGKTAASKAIGKGKAKGKSKAIGKGKGTAGGAGKAAAKPDDYATKLAALPAYDFAKDATVTKSAQTRGWFASLDVDKGIGKQYVDGDDWRLAGAKRTRSGKGKPGYHEVLPTSTVRDLNELLRAATGKTTIDYHQLGTWTLRTEVVREALVVSDGLRIDTSSGVMAGLAGKVVWHSGSSMPTDQQASAHDEIRRAQLELMHQVGTAVGAGTLPAADVGKALALGMAALAIAHVAPAEVANTHSTAADAYKGYSGVAADFEKRRNEMKGRYDALHSLSSSAIRAIADAAYRPYLGKVSSPTVPRQPALGRSRSLEREETADPKAKGPFVGQGYVPSKLSVLAVTKGAAKPLASTKLTAKAAKAAGKAAKLAAAAAKASATLTVAAAAPAPAASSASAASASPAEEPPRLPRLAPPADVRKWTAYVTQPFREDRA